jgi:hypothetical protein
MIVKQVIDVFLSAHQLGPTLVDQLAKLVTGQTDLACSSPNGRWCAVIRNQLFKFLSTRQNQPLIGSAKYRDRRTINVLWKLFSRNTSSSVVNGILKWRICQFIDKGPERKGISLLQGDQTRTKGSESTGDAESRSLIEILSEVFHEIMITFCIITGEEEEAVDIVSIHPLWNSQWMQK